MNAENSRTNEPHKSVLNLSKVLDLRQICCFSKFMYLLRVEKYKKTV